MKIYLNIIICLIAITFISCSSNNVNILIEQPINEELDNKVMSIKINEKEIFKNSLKATIIASTYQELTYKVDENSNNIMKVYIDDEVFVFNFTFPKDKYIIISPTFNHEKVNVSILKQSKKFTLF